MNGHLLFELTYSTWSFETRLRHVYPRSTTMTTTTTADNLNLAENGPSFISLCDAQREILSRYATT